MRFLIGVTLSLLLAAPGADAAIFGLFGGHKGRHCLPRAIDSPKIRPKVKDRHKEGKRGGTMTFVEVLTEYRDSSGAVVAESRSTVIETSQAPGS